MVGPLRSMTGGFIHLLVAVAIFTKWTEAKPIKKLDSKTTIKFMMKIIYRFDITHNIITDNGSNSDSDEFKDFCRSHGPRVDFASITHPQTNGHVERANAMILQGFKPRLMRDLEHAADCWPSVLWGLRSTTNHSTNFTPLFMVYGVEAVLSSALLHNSP